MEKQTQKPRILFPFVEAGLGHIMPMRAIADAFTKKYGDKAEVVRVNFFQDTKDKRLEFVEKELVREVKLHNKHKINGSLQFLLMRLFGSKFSLKFVMQRHYKEAFEPALKYMQDLNADLIVNTHFSTLYYSCEAKERGLINAEIVTYCPDPVIGRQWDNRSDIIALSSESGKEKAIKQLKIPESKLKVVPFLIRNEVTEYTKNKEYYRRELGLPEDNFTVLLADGAYGAGRLGKTVKELLKTKQKLTIVAVCGRNEKLYNEFKTLKAPSNIHFTPYGFTDKMLTLSASCDLFVGKAGASNLAEPAYFGAPSIVTFCATPIEKWICNHHTSLGSAIKCENVKKAVKTVEEFNQNPSLMNKYKKACVSQHRADGPEILADILWDKLTGTSKE